MKRQLLALLLSGISVGAFCQDWQIGPEIGVNIIPMDQTDLGQNYQLGWHAGGNVEYYLNDQLSLRSGIFATQKRQAYSSSDTIPLGIPDFIDLDDILGIDGLNLDSYQDISGTVSQFYVQIPLMLGYSYQDFSIFGGGYVGYMFSARTKETEIVRTPFMQAIDVNELAGDIGGGLLNAFLPDPYREDFTETSSTSGLRSFDAGLKAGLRYQREGLGVNLYYSRGFLDYQTISKSSTDVHNYFQISVNYNFGL